MLLNEDEIYDYLDTAISIWTHSRDVENDETAEHYVNAFQSIKETLFGSFVDE